MNAKSLWRRARMALINASCAKATYTYTYTGNPLTSCSGPGCVKEPPYPVITASFTLGSPLGANLSYGAITPLSWEITDGTTVLTNTNSTLAVGVPLQIGTSSGVITEWSFYAEVLGNINFQIQMYTSNIPPSTPNYVGPEDASSEQFGSNVIINNANHNKPGAWTSTVTCSLSA